jgi:membrane-bound lytic murein transglycosylase D
MLLTAVLALSFELKALAVTSPAVRVHEFPVPPRIAEKVWFWEVVFNRYPSTSTIVHDLEHPHLVVDIINFENLAQRNSNSGPPSKKERDQITSKYLKRYELAMTRIRNEGKGALRYGPMEKRIYAVYARNEKTMRHLMSGSAVLRTQAGLKDEFAKAALRANQWLPYMEKTFSARGLPIDLTRIAFVESMFNLNAVSKVGASGIWQFMPATARRYLVVTPFLDERNSPTKATRAAASLLSFNYQELGTWPLAITAYNHGAASLGRAMRQLGTNELSEIIDQYKGSTFGFASRNFYSEFIAARNVYKMNYAYRGERGSNPLAITTISISKPVTLNQIMSHTPLNKALLRKYNPCIQARAFGMRRQVHLPANYELVVPNYMAADVAKAIARIHPLKRRG